MQHVYHLAMSKMKSHTLVSRTFAKVKHRISSIGSLVSVSTDAPNPLLAPPPTLDSRNVSNTTTAPTRVSSRPASSPVLDSNTPTASTPPIAALSISTESWTVFNTHPKYHAVAYVKFDISCHLQTEGIIVPSTTNPPSAGYLHDLSLHLDLSGPGTTLSHYGNLTHHSLQPTDNSSTDGHWINLIHIGIKDTSLASKLSTSFRSISRSAGRSIGKSAGRLGRYTNIDLINKWLTILESDPANTEREIREPVIVHATVKYRHSLLPSSTELRDKCSCKVKMNRDEMERGVLSSVDLSLEITDSAKRRNGRVVRSWYGRNRREDSDDEDEERIQEARVLGAPWL